MSWRAGGKITLLEVLEEGLRKRNVMEVILKEQFV